ncbi:MAG: glutamate--cysteine ligase [Bdellovibrionales bacterium]|nr:glutamate--cysteine ligase [Oligoflexia bacterium]
MSPINHLLKTKNVIANAVFANRDEVKAWFDQKFREFPASFYCSVDIRDSGEKVAPVDCNLFPAGFNNICEVDLDHAHAIFKAQIERMAEIRSIPLPEKILIIPENHTENKFYLENLFYLKNILEEGGFEVAFGRYGEDSQTYQLVTASEKEITEYPLKQENGLLQTDIGFVPDWILLNNDFSQGYPDCLDGVKQPIFPSYKLGWHSRKKSTHFDFYNKLAEEFAALIKLDPWYITIESEAVDQVSFSEGMGIDRVIEVAERMFQKITSDFERHQIDRKPALFVKNDAGTYGMGIMVINSVDELKQMNRRTKNKMSMGKNKSTIDQVLIQEGVPTIMTSDGHTAEPVIYMMGEQLIGGFIRANSERNDMDNLNSQGMFFKKLCFQDLSTSLETGDREKFPTLEAVYGIVAKLSSLAAAMELKDTKA